MRDGMKVSLFVTLSDWKRRCYGIEMIEADAIRLVDEITYKKASEAADLATQSAILGPFFQTDHKIRKKGESVVEKCPEGAEVAYIYGKVVDAMTKKPVKSASIDIWEASTNGRWC
jgi:protocatechuate 3,4-dioxygenase beta subunit